MLSAIPEWLAPTVVVVLALATLIVIIVLHVTRPKSPPKPKSELERLHGRQMGCLIGIAILVLCAVAGINEQLDDLADRMDALESRIQQIPAEVMGAR